MVILNQILDFTLILVVSALTTNILLKRHYVSSFHPKFPRNSTVKLPKMEESQLTVTILLQRIKIIASVPVGLWTLDSETKSSFVSEGVPAN